MARNSRLKAKHLFCSVITFTHKHIASVRNVFSEPKEDFVFHTYPWDPDTGLTAA